MRLNKIEFQLCMKYFGFHTDTEVEETDRQKIDRGKICEHLVEQKMIIMENGRYVFTPLGQYIVHTIGTSDVSLRIEGAKKIREIYIRDENYICVDQRKEDVELYLLPSFPLVVGACASAFDDSDIKLAGLSEKENFLMNITHSGNDIIVYQKKNKEESHKYYKKADCINEIVLWILTNLRKVEG